MKSIDQGQVMVQGLEQRLFNSGGQALFVFPAQVQFHIGVNAVDAFMVVPKI